LCFFAPPSYSCLSGQQCYVCNAGYEWFESVGIAECRRVTAACGHPLDNPWSPGYTAYCGGIYAFTKGCVSNLNENNSCCSGTIENPDWDYDYQLPIVRY
jgi:hypothetical protein